MINPVSKQINERESFSTDMFSDAVISDKLSASIFVGFLNAGNVAVIEESINRRTCNGPTCFMIDGNNAFKRVNIFKSIGLVVERIVSYLCFVVSIELIVS